MENHWSEMKLRNLGRTLRGTSVLILLLLSISLADAQCPTNFVRVHNKCYFFSKEPLQWMESYYHCREMNSSMLVLPNKHQDARILRYLRKGYLLPTAWWIGAIYDWKQRTWKWAPSGHTVTYSRFTEKIHNMDLQWHCALLDPMANFKWWNARKCLDKNNFVCQKKLDEEEGDINNELPTISSPYSHIYENIDNGLKTNSQPAYIKNRPVRRKSKPDPSKPKFICPKGYRHFRRNCYKFSKDTATWQNAYFNCDGEFNGTLAIIHDKREDKALRRVFKRMGPDSEERWIGGVYDWEDMSWKWARDGTIIQHQSKDRELLRWHCLIWSPSVKNKWTSDNCVKQKHYICKTEGTLIQFPKDLKTFPTKSQPKNLRPMRIMTRPKNAVP